MLHEYGAAARHQVSALNILTKDTFAFCQNKYKIILLFPTTNFTKSIFTLELFFTPSELD